MKMSASSIFVIALLVAGVVSQNAGTTNITSISNDGFDVILLDSPSWCTKVQVDHGVPDSFSVFGEKTLRLVYGSNSTTGSTGFYALPITDPWVYPLIDLHTFWVTSPVTGNSTQYTFGATDYSPDAGSRFDDATGPYIPLFYATQQVGTGLQSSQAIQPARNALTDFTGFLNYALRIDLSNITNQDIITYWAGFVIDNSQENMAVNFTLTRTHFQIGSGINNPSVNHFTYTPMIDTFPLYQNNFASFSADYKPWVHFMVNMGPSRHTVVVVVDPNSRGVYAVDVNVFGGQVSSYMFAGANFQNYEVVSTNINGGMLFVGLGASGFAPGYIYVFNFGNGVTVPQPTGYPLPQNYSNPKALTSDGFNLYIGMNGWPEIVRMSLSNYSITGYQRLPEYLHRSWDATNTNDHVYFVTYEQNSKVFRVAKTDFCSSVCTNNAYCKNGKCQCVTGFIWQSGADNVCVAQVAKEVIVEKQMYEKAHGGEVALGILFALTFIAAAIGWFMWYRGRGGRGAYQSV